MPVLDAFRTRIDATRSSMVVEQQAESETTDVWGQPWQRFELGLSGTVDGLVALQGPVPESAADRYSWLYDVPELCLPQEHLLLADRLEPYPLPVRPGEGNTSQPLYASARFEAADGAGLTIFCPRQTSGWNGKLFMVQHGSGNYPRLGPLWPRRRADLFTPGAGAHLFVEAMIDQGYAVAYCRKDASRPPLGVSTAKIEGGTTVRTTFVAHAALALAMTEYARAFVCQALGSTPRRTYFYGHSGGGITAHVLNFSPGANRCPDGSAIIDGFLADDAGNGLYLPIAFREGEDVLLRHPEDRVAFVPQIDLTRQLYNPASYLAAKRLTARLLRDKGLASKHRLYEIRGVSHFDAGQMELPGTPNAVDLGGLMAAAIGVLDRWVDQGIAAPESRSDAPGYEPAIALPEVACPLGVYYSGAEGFSGNPGAMRTTLAAFDGGGAIPISPDTGQPIDMGASGAVRETVEAAWRRLGLIGAEEGFSEAAYRTQLSRAVARCVEEGWLPGEVGVWYVREAGSLLHRSGVRW